MKYEKIAKAIFLERPNRFVARVLLNGREETVHVKNTGRCRELLIPGKAEVYLEDCGEKISRKTRYSLIAVKKGDQIINMDSQAPNRVAGEWLQKGGLGQLSLLRPESTFGKSRFDFYYEREKGRAGYLEVKGVTLEENGIVRFPDAPTERGVRHLEELILAKNEGFEAAVLFVIQMERVKCFEPNWVTQPAFGEALCRAEAAGVKLLAHACRVTADSLTLAEAVPMNLKRSI